MATTRDEIKRRLREKFSKGVKPKKMAMTPPRYDDVYFGGVAWLDSLSRADKTEDTMEINPRGTIKG